MKMPGPTGPQAFSPGILFAQAAKPSAERIHLTPYLLTRSYPIRSLDAQGRL